MTERWELHPGDDGYPDQLACVPRPPDTLYVMGDPRLLEPGLAIIGARKATPYGLICASRFAGWAARHGATVVSGAAIGCDLAAHSAAAQAGGTTVAVLGCGADVDYPRASTQLLRDLRESHAVVSEVPWGTPPQRWAFSERNRIIAGLSCAVLVVEAGLPSGTFGTADHALAAGRDVLAVPGSILSPESRGSNRLICEGCTPITCESELRDALFAAGLAPSTDTTCEDSSIESLPDPLMRALAASPMRPDDLAFHLHLDIVSVARALSALELEGVVGRLRDGRYSILAKG